MRTGSPMSSTNTSAPVPCATPTSSSRTSGTAQRGRGGAGRERAGADDQLDRLGDRHEVAGHALVGDGHRAAALDLAAEDRHDAARGAEHVAEAHRRVAGVGEARRGGLQRELGERLRGAHHGRRRHRLVGRDEHEALHARARRRRARRPGWRSRCCGPPRPGWPPSARRACRRRRGRRPSGGARRTPRACAPPPCSRRAPAASTDGGTWRSSSSSRWIEKRLSSAWSSSTIRRGSTRAIWRHSSEPIEPPAPVTSTVSPAR